MEQDGKQDERTDNLQENTLPIDLDTNRLINSFKSPTSNNNVSHFMVDQSTTDIINTNINSLNPKTHRNISESTVFLDSNNEPKTPLRRNLSGSSLEIIPSSMNRTYLRSPTPVGNLIQEPKEINIAELYFLLGKLPFTSKILHFKSILLKYLDSLRDHDINISSERFIITIYNQLRNPSDTAKLNKLVDIFVNAPANEAMKLANFQHFKEFKFNSSILEIWTKKVRKFSKLKRSEAVWTIYLKRKHLSSWKLKYDIIVEELMSNALIFNRVKILMRLWDIWRSKSHQLYSLKQVADINQKAKFVNLWKDKIIMDYEKSSKFYERTLVQKAFKQWNLKKQLMSFKIDIMPYLKSWANTTKTVKTMQNDAKLLEVVFHCGFFFTKWKEKTESITSEYSDLVQIADNLYTSKFFDKWLETYKYRNIETSVLLKRDELLKEFLLKQWLQRSNHKKMLSKHISSGNLDLKRKVILSWKQKGVLNIRSIEFNQKNLVSKFFRTWKNNATLTFYMNDKRVEIVEHSLNRWKRQLALKKNLKMFQIKLNRTTWNNWNLVIQQHYEMLQMSDYSYEVLLKRSHLQLWTNSLNQIKNDNQIADNFSKKFFLNKWNRKLKSIQHLEEEADEYYASDPHLHGKKKYFKLWINNNEKVIESRLSLKLEEFNKVITASKISAVFKIWNNQYHSYLTQERIFEEDFLKKLYVEPIFVQWLYKFNFYKSLAMSANSMNALNLKSTGFAKLQLKMLKVEELRTAFLEYEEDTNLKVILKYLNLWSLKSMKMKRDNEAILSFRKRWIRAHSRAILLLWNGKTIDRNSSILNRDGGDDFEDTSLMEEDDSPTKLKSIVKSEFQAQTPQKVIIDPFNTYYNGSLIKSSIPGSEKVIRKRIEALKSHYNQIKYAIPSPLKMESNPNEQSNISLIKLASNKKIDFSKGKSNIPTQIPEIPNPLKIMTSSPYLNSSHSFKTDEFITGDDVDANLLDAAERSIATPMISMRNIETHRPRSRSSGLF